jgi:hypothetical protein
MAENKIRLSQIVGIFGPGAMLDLPDRSVLIHGIDQWEMTGIGTFKVIEEPRLQRLLHLRLQDDPRLSSDRPPEFRTPPIDLNDPRRRSPAIKATVFPRWFACDAIAGDPPSRRRLARFQDLEPPKYLDWKSDDGKRRKASPIRFVCGCENGHLQDINWRWVVHQNRGGGERGGGDVSALAGACKKALWLEDVGTTADPRDTRVTCECGASISLEELSQPRRLGPCGGERPWIGDLDPIPCDAQNGLRLLTRSATNTYFPQIVRVISLPQTIDELARRIDLVWSVIGDCKTIADIQAARRFNAEVRANLHGYSDEDVLARVLSLGDAAKQLNRFGPRDSLRLRTDLSMRHD